MTRGVQPNHHMRILALILFFLVAGLTPNRSALAQSSGNAPLTFDLLQAARAADSLRTVVSRQRGEIARLNKTVSALADSIKSTRKTVDTVRLIATRVDTVRLDSVRAPTASAERWRVRTCSNSGGTSPITWRIAAT